MQIGMVGLGRMGYNMALRLVRGGHQVVGTTREADRLKEAAAQGIRAASSAEELALALEAPRAVWMMIPSGKPVDDLIERLLPVLGSGDLLVDGGNSNYRDSLRRAKEVTAHGVRYVDAGVSGGIWGLEIGYCMMLGGDDASIARLRPALDTLAPVDGWRHVGPLGAGHFSKMVHNGIEYGLMQAYAEGFELLRASEFNYDLAGLADLWNHGGVVRSWLLELAGRAFEEDPGLERIRGYVSDSGEGRWTIQEAIERDVPVPAAAIALFSRFRSRQDDSFRDKVIAALRNQFGGHAVREKTAGGSKK